MTWELKPFIRQRTKKIELLSKERNIILGLITDLQYSRLSAGRAPELGERNIILGLITDLQYLRLSAGRAPELGKEHHFGAYHRSSVFKTKCW